MCALTARTCTWMLDPGGHGSPGDVSERTGIYLRVIVADQPAVLFRSDPSQPFEYLRGEGLTDALETLPWVAVGSPDLSS